jgi:hypothetical protein
MGHFIEWAHDHECKLSHSDKFELKGMARTHREKDLAAINAFSFFVCKEKEVSVIVVAIKGTYIYVEVGRARAFYLRRPQARWAPNFRSPGSKKLTTLM